MEIHGKFIVCDIIDGFGTKEFTFRWDLIESISKDDNSKANIQISGQIKTLDMDYDEFKDTLIQLMKPGKNRLS